PGGATFRGAVAPEQEGHSWRRSDCQEAVRFPECRFGGLGLPAKLVETAIEVGRFVCGPARLHCERPGECAKSDEQPAQYRERSRFAEELEQERACSATE
ncbi:MAG: hypothetical protein O7F08_10490, partial [Deltaproteobacteria bacterium]|nr:hypothetical protein [Deltaproteobacteria bacterium]